jgi:hypothetical protein
MANAQIGVTHLAQSRCQRFSQGTAKQDVSGPVIRLGCPLDRIEMQIGKSRIFYERYAETIQGIDERLLGLSPKFQWRRGEFALVPQAVGVSSGFRFLSTAGSA